MNVPLGEALLLLCLWSIEGGSPTISPATNVDSKIAILAFVADWAGPCLQVQPILDELQESGYEITKVNVDRDRDEANRHGVKSIPTVVLIRDGVEQDRMSGVFSKVQFEQRFRRAGISKRILPKADVLSQQADSLPGAESVETLTRARFRCGAERSQRLNAYLQEELGNRIESSISGDVMVITGSRRDVERLSGLIELLLETEFDLE